MLLGFHVVIAFSALHNVAAFDNNDCTGGGRQLERCPTLSRLLIQQKSSVTTLESSTNLSLAPSALPPRTVTEALAKRVANQSSLVTAFLDVAKSATYVDLETLANSVISPTKGGSTIAIVAKFVVVVLAPGMIGFAVYLYHERGLDVVCSIIAYLIFLTTIQFSVKMLTTTFDFDYPAFITTAHFISSFLCGLCMMRHRSRTTGSPMIKPTLHEFSFFILPLALAFAAATLLTNSALLYCSIAYVQIIGSTTPLFSACMTILCGLPFDRWLFLASSIVVVGTGMSVRGEVKLSLIGTCCALSANTFRAVKATMTQYIMQKEYKDKFDPCSLLTWMCFASIFAMAIVSAVGEGLAPWNAFAGAKRPAAFYTAFVFSCLNAAGLNFFALVVTKELGAVGQQISGQLKNVLCFAGGIVVFGEIVQLLEIFGFIVVLLGINLYQVFDRQLKKKMQAAKG